jgi:hypothetical protein
MLSSIFAFLGGSVFRMIWGEISAYVDKRMEHKHEMQRMELQERFAAQQHDRNLLAIRQQAELGIQVIRVQGEADQSRIESEAWLEAVKATGRTVGIAWVDAWNAVIRPAVATWSVAMLTLNEIGAFTLSEPTSQVCFAALGLYLADRTLAKRSK